MCYSLNCLVEQSEKKEEVKIDLTLTQPTREKRKAKYGRGQVCFLRGIEEYHHATCKIMLVAIHVLFYSCFFQRRRILSGDGGVLAAVAEASFTPPKSARSSRSRSIESRDRFDPSTPMPGSDDGAVPVGNYINANNSLDC